MKRISLLFLLFIVSVTLHAQDCLTLCTLNPGTDLHCAPCDACCADTQWTCPGDQNCDRNHCCKKNNYFGKTHFNARSQSRDTARWLAGHTDYTYTFDTPVCHANLSIIFSYTQNWDRKKTATFLLPTCCPCFNFGADDQENTMVSSQNFGLSTTHNATVCIEPIIQNFITDFHIDFNLDGLLCGAFAYIDLPLTHSWRQTKVCADEHDLGQDLFPDCLMSNAFNIYDQLEPVSVGSAFAIDAVSRIQKFGDVGSPQCYGLVAGDRGAQTSRTGLADVRWAIGYTLIDRPWLQLGIKMVGALPAGNRPRAIELWELIVGNGGHYELGGGAIGAIMVHEWCLDHNLLLTFDTELTHMFTSRLQRRLFDLKRNGPWSRYLLLKQFSDDGSAYNGLQLGANVFAQLAKIQIDLQTDSTILLSYLHCGTSVEVGYNLWTRSRERIERLCCCIGDRVYGIKGTVPVCIDDDPTDVDIRTASLSTIRQSMGIEGADDGPEPVFVTCDDLDISSAIHPATLSHAIVMTLGHTWLEHNQRPYIGIGGKIEFSGKGNTALNIGEFWLKGMLLF